MCGVEVSDLKQRLETWASEQHVERIEETEKPYGWTEISTPRFASEMLDLLWPVIEAVTSEPLQVVGKTKDGRPLHRWAKHERLERALEELETKLGKF